MGHKTDSNRLTLARAKQLADEIRHVAQRTHELSAKFDRGFSYAGMCGGLQSVLEHLVRDACGEEGRSLIEAAFKDAYAPRAAAASERVAGVPA